MFRKERAVLLTKKRRDLVDDVRQKRRWRFLYLLIVVLTLIAIFGLRLL